MSPIYYLHSMQLCKMILSIAWLCRIVDVQVWWAFPGGIRWGTQTDSRCVSAVLFLKLKDRYPCIYYIIFSLVLYVRNISQYSSQRSKSESEVTQLYLTLCDCMDCCLPGSSIHGIFQARILEWAAISFSRGLKERRSSLRLLSLFSNHKDTLASWWTPFLSCVSLKLTENVFPWPEKKVPL